MAYLKTKRSLSVAAAGSLAFASLAVAPAAFAVDPITTVPEAGTVYAVTDATDFNLKAQITNAALNGGAEVLKWRIVDADGGLTNAGIDLGDGAAGAANGVLEAGDDTLGVFADGVAVVASTVNAAGGSSVLILDPADGTDSFSVTVQAWMDFDLDGTIDTAAGSEEVAGPVRTVTFHDDDDVTYVTSFTQPALGDANLVATVASSPAVNTEQSAAVQVAFGTLAGGVYANLGNALGAGVFTAGEALADGKYTHAFGGNGVTAANYVAVAVQGGAEAGAEVFRTVAVGAADGIGAITIVDTADTEALNVRLGTSSITAQVKVTDGGDALAGATVTWSLNDAANFGADTVVTAGGQTLEDGDADALSVTSVTGADGVATLPISIAGQTAAAAALITIDAKVDAVAPAAQISVAVVEEADASINDFNLLGTNAINQIAEESSTTVSVVVLDNLGEGLSGSGWRVKLDNGLAGANLVTSFAGLNSNGVATFSLTDTDNGVEVWTATVQKFAANAGVWNDTARALVVTPSLGASISGANVTVNADANVTINKAALSAADERLGADGPTVNAASADITGTVTTSAGAVGHTSVTISSPGVLFEVATTGAGFVYAFDSVTVRTNAAGVYAGVKAISNTVGKKTITVASGSASDSFDLTFNGVAKSEGTDLAVSVTNAEAGKTMTVTATLTDEWGNPVQTANADDQILVTYDGPGFVVGDLPLDTNADGVASFKVLLGANDVITGSVTVQYDQDSDAAFDGDDDLSTSVDLAPATATKVNAGSFKGYVAVYARGYEGQRLSAKIGKDWVIVDPIVNNQENGTLFRVTDFTGAGVDIAVRIYIDRVLIDTINLTTK